MNYDVNGRPLPNYYEDSCYVPNGTISPQNDRYNLQYYDFKDNSSQVSNPYGGFTAYKQSPEKNTDSYLFQNSSENVFKTTSPHALQPRTSPLATDPNCPTKVNMDKSGENSEYIDLSSWNQSQDATAKPYLVNQKTGSDESAAKRRRISGSAQEDHSPEQTVPNDVIPVAEQSSPQNSSSFYQYVTNIQMNTNTRDNYYTDQTNYYEESNNNTATANAVYS